MKPNQSPFLWMLVLGVSLLFLFIVYLKAGAYSTTWGQMLDAIFYPTDSLSTTIVWSFRLPRILMAFLAGGALSVAGMHMQNLFNNSLAGPDILGITSGSSLMVALWAMTGWSLLGTSDVILLGILGALGMGIIMLMFAYKLKSVVHLLLLGLMLGSFISAIISIVQASSASQDLQRFVFWNFGNLQRVNLDQILPVGIVFFVGLTLSMTQVRSLNAMVLGEEHAQSLGISLRAFRLMGILIAAILTGTITAYVGPIAFVGLAVPNATKLWFKTQKHGLLLGANVLLGALFLGLCDLLIVYFEPYLSLPLNAITSLIGVPFICWMILKYRYVAS